MDSNFHGDEYIEYNNGNDQQLEYYIDQQGHQQHQHQMVSKHIVNNKNLPY